MNVDFEKAVKPFRKLRKLLKTLAPDPGPEEVHDLRTEARRLEAVLHALAPETGPEARQVLKLVKPLRRSAGRVRDMDVLIAKAAELSSVAGGDGLTKLLERMAAVRAEQAGRLYRGVKRRRKPGRRILKRCIRDIEGLGPDASPAPARELAAQLEQWPKLHKENLHDFRRTVKELRYILQLVPDVDPRLMDAYSSVKDSTGEWHDWLELLDVSAGVLAAQRDAALLQAIRDRLQETLRLALTTANSLRKRGFELPLAA